VAEVGFIFLELRTTFQQIKAVLTFCIDSKRSTSNDSTPKEENQYISTVLAFNKDHATDL
jgi:hypothetical protein